jgi:hypothetical protein
MDPYLEESAAKHGLDLPASVISTLAEAARMDQLTVMEIYLMVCEAAQQVPAGESSAAALLAYRLLLQANLGLLQLKPKE